VFLHLDDTRPEPAQIDRAANLASVVVLSGVGHALLFLLLMWLVSQPFFQQVLAQLPQPVPQPVPVTPPQDRPSPPFVMVEPRIDREALRRIERPAPLSDIDREARSRERNPNATNNQPFLRGRSADLTEAARERAERARGQGPNPQPTPPTPQPTAPHPTPSQNAANTATPPPTAPVPNAPPSPRPAPNNATPATGRVSPPPGGSLGDAIRDVERYARGAQLNNPNGGNEVDPTIQFDSKGVEFGPWLRRFVAQVKRNWFVPYAAMSLKGHVVITFNVHKDGRITDLTVIRPSDVSAFNNAAFNALASPRGAACSSSPARRPRRPRRSTRTGTSRPRSTPSACRRGSSTSRARPRAPATSRAPTSSTSRSASSSGARAGPRATPRAPRSSSSQPSSCGRASPAGTRSRASTTTS
jgi:TonB family protein